MNKIKKILSVIFLVIILCGIAHPSFATIVNHGTEKWVAGQYDSNIYTTDNKKNSGMLIRRLTNYNTGEKITVFCVEKGIDSTTGAIENGTHLPPTDELMKQAGKIAYFGWYSKYGDYAIDGGILAADMIWVKEDYVFTQQYIWEVLGQSTATFKEQDVQNRYIAFRENVKQKIANIEKIPYFGSETIEIEVGTTTLTDTNGVLKDYVSIDKTVNGIRIVHNYGENTIKVTVDENCNLESYIFTKDEMESYGLIKEETRNHNTTVYITFRDGVQNQLYAMNYNNPVSMSLRLKINSFGKLELSKLNTQGDLINGAIFKIEGNNYNKEVAVTNGKITLDKLREGYYTITEIHAPDGYLLNTEKYEVEIKPNQTSKQVIINEEPTGEIHIVKEDSETGKTPQGDATFLNAKYEVYADEDIYNKAKTKKFYSKGDLIATRSIDDNGNTEKIVGLPLGKYKVKEVFCSKGYLIDSKEYQINLEYQNQNSKIISKTVISYEKVKKMQVHIFKSGNSANSGLVAGIEGAEFTIKLESDIQKAYSLGYSYEEVWNGIDKNGKLVSVDKNRVEQAQKIAPTYEKITTDKDGNAYTKSKLPFGKYIVKETIIPKDFKCGQDFTFSITEDESEFNEIEQKIKHLYVNNEPLQTYLKITKKDLKTDKTVTLNSSTFEIKAIEDIYDKGTGKILYKKGEKIKQKVGGTTYSTFTTNADNIVVPTGSYNNSRDDKGSVTIPLLLSVGTYEVIEVKPPEGFLQLEENIIFKIEDIESYEKNQNGDYIKEIIVKNEQPTGNLIINKTIALNENINTSEIDTSDLSEIQFKLIAKEHIIDFADGSIIYKKGEEINIYNLDKNGELKIENLPLGIYEIQEIKTLDCLVLDNTKYEVKFIQKDKVTEIYEEKKGIENQIKDIPTHTEIPVIQTGRKVNNILLISLIGISIIGVILGIKHFFYLCKSE